MAWLGELWRRLAALARRNQMDADLEDEMRLHVELRSREQIGAGTTVTEARYAAQRRFGNTLLLKEASRETYEWRLLETFQQDIRYGLRVMQRTPAFTAAVVLTLALGTGANTAMFSLVDAFLLRLLPVKDPQQLVFIRHREPNGGSSGGFTYHLFEALRDRNQSFSGMFAYDISHINVAADGESDYVDCDFVSGSYFDVLGVGAIAGRTFTADEDQPGKPNVAVISHAYWTRRFARDPSWIGKTVYLGGVPFSLIGVTPPTFLGRNVAGNSADIVLPMFVHPQLAFKDHNTFEIMGRLRPGAGIEQARADLDVIAQGYLVHAAGSQLSAKVQQEIHAQTIVLTPGLRGTAVDDDRFARELRTLTWVAGVALLLACVNIANLLLARGYARQKEIALRLAIGAGRMRLVRQLLTECMLLALAGGAAGLLLAKLGMGLIVGVLSLGGDPVSFDLHPNASVLAFTAGVSLLAGILFGLVPAASGTRIDLNARLKGSELRANSGRTGARLARSLVISQVALSLVLMISAGLLIRSLRLLYRVDTGYEREKVLMAWVLPVLAGYDHVKELALYRELFDRMNAIPGVQSASVARMRPVFGQWYQRVWVQGATTGENEVPEVYYGPVGPRFFETMQIPLLLGREFSLTDTEAAAKVAIISESAARILLPNENPIGQHIGFDGLQSSGKVEIVGVVRDIRHHPRERQSRPAVYVPYTQAPPEGFGQMNILVRTGQNPTSVIGTVRRQVQSLDNNLPFSGAETPKQELDKYLGEERSLAALLSTFGALALILTAVGLYGTTSYTVSRRTREMGIRIALGARRDNLLWMVLRETSGTVTIGVAIGTAASLIAARLIASKLFGVGMSDPMTISIVILFMFATALAAAYIPARRATNVDPMEALRHE
jgi:predicted permease